MHNIQYWVNSLLRMIGTPDGVASWMDTVLLLAVILLLAWIIDLILNKVLVGLFRRMAVRTKTDWDDLILDRKIIHKIIRIVPALFIFGMVPYAFPAREESSTLLFIQKVCLIYVIAVSVQFVTGLLTLANDLYNRRQSGRSIKGFIQVIEIVIVGIGLIIVIGILFDKEVGKLIAGLGASAAVLMLVFKDSILGFVAGIQLSSNDMLRTGDWITMSKYGADGTVIDITLNAIKVRNFDNTIVTIPPYSLVSDSFQNWRGMADSPGRRIKRSVNIDMSSVQFCTPEMLEKFKKIGLLTDYMVEKEKELQEYNATCGIDESVLVNGRRQTNLGVFRAYIQEYLRQHPSVSKELNCMVRHLQPTEKGIPIELYFFSSEKRWVLYEGIQADVFDHLLAVVPEFELRVFQAVSGADIRSLKEG